MNVLILALFLTPVFDFNDEQPTTRERILIETTINKCKNAKVKLDPVFMMQLLRIEKAFTNPSVYHYYEGMTLTRACRESGFNPLAIGDNGKAVGLYQWWSWADVDRKDPVASALYLYERIHYQLNNKNKVERYCGRYLRRLAKRKGYEEMKKQEWRIAYVRSIRGFHPSGRCTTWHTPKEFKLHRKWYKK